MQEISWDTATRTANSDFRIAGAVKLVRDGQWEYRLNTAAPKGTWWAKNLETGEILRTGQTNMVDVRRFMYERNRATNPQLTIVGGPQRARAGHQRYTTAFAA